MSENLVSLWPDQIRPIILSPMTILKAQAEALATQTGGMLLGDVKHEEREGNKVALAFEFVVPALDNYRHSILNVAHDKDLPYPAVIDAEVLRPGGILVFDRCLKSKLGAEGKFANKADSDQEFIEIIKKVLQSAPVLSSAQSLIARANEALAEKGQQVHPIPSYRTDEPSAEAKRIGLGGKKKIVIGEQKKVGPGGKKGIVIGEKKKA